MHEWHTPTAGLAVLVALAGCSPTGEVSGDVQVSEGDSAGVAVVAISGDVSSLPLWEVSDVPITSIRGDAPPYLARVGEVEFLEDGGLLVEDNQSDELRRFDSGGNVVSLLGGAGEGPGEFQNLTELTVAIGDTAYAYDRRLYRITSFDPAGELLGSVTVGRESGGRGTLAMDAWALDSEHVYLYRLSPWDSTRAQSLPYRDQRDVLLYRLGPTGEPLSEPLRFRGEYSISGDFGDAGAPFSNRPTIAVAAGRVVHTSGLDYELTVSGPDLEPRRIIRWTGWREPLTDDFLQAVYDTTSAGWDELRRVRPEIVESLMEGLFAPELLPDTLPALGPVFMDDGGRIWVSRFRPRVYRWDQTDVWHVISAEGRPLARVELPADARLAAVRRDRIALIVRDSLDVQDVRVYGLETEGGGR